MKNLITRTLTGTAFVVCITASLLYSPLSFTLFFLLIEVLSLLEFYKMVKKQSKPQIILGTLTGAYIFVSTFLWHYSKTNLGIYLSSFIIVLIMSIFITELYRKHKRPLLNVGVTLLGLVYIALPFSLLNHLVYIYGHYQGALVLGIFILMWTFDTGAYLSGMSFGKHRLFERVSPKKSWEGFFGGMILTFVAAFIMQKYFNQLYNYEWYAVALIISVFGTMGDLVESLFKRSLDIKDSGKILPGHGGILDRIDGILISAPIIFVLFFVLVK